MGMLDNLLGGLGGVPGKGSAKSASKPFARHLTVTDGDAAYDTVAEVVAIIGALAAGSVDTLVWQMTVPAQQAYRWGFGSPATPQNQGYVFFCSLDTNVDFQVGIVTLVQANANETTKYKVKELDDTSLHGTTVTTLATATLIDKNEMIALPEQTQFKKVGEDSLMQVYYRCITAATAEDNVGFRLPVTAYYK